MIARPFERAFDAAAGRQRTACSRCGDSQIPGKLVVLIEDGNELSECPECGRFRGPNGDLLGGDGRHGSFDGQFKVVYLCPDDVVEDTE